MKKTLFTILLVFCLSISSFAMPLESQYDKSKDAKNIENIVNFILGVNQKKGDQEGLIYLVGDTIDIQMLFEDIEKDYEGISLVDKLQKNEELDDEQKKPKAGTLQIKYAHDPSIFDNPDTKHAKGNNIFRTITDMQDPYVIQKASTGMRGEWTVMIQGGDTTKNAPFDKMAEPKTRTYKIHEAPVAIINKLETATHILLTGADSYDRDFRNSLPNNGIISYEWFYELSDGSFHKYPEEKQYISLPRIIDGKEVKAYTLSVTDCYGAKGSTNVTGVITPKLFAELHPELTKFDIFGIGIPASEELKVTDIITMPYQMDSIDFALYKDGVRKTNLKTMIGPGDVDWVDVMYYHWKNIRNYMIPETLPDDTYTARIRATQGALVLEKSWNIKVNTPINLQPSMPALVRTDETYDILAQTTKYANKVEVTAFKGTPYQSGILNLDGSISGDISNWIKPFKIPSTIPEGIYTFEFRATTPNGNQEIKTVEVYVEALKVEASLKPNPALAGDEIIFTVYTKGYVDRIEIDVDPDIIAKDDRVGKYTYPTLKFNVNGAIDEKTDTLKYILPLKTDQTISKDDIRLRDEYTFIVRGYRGTNSKEVELKLDVRRSLLDLLRPGVKTN